jgi:hypothetical protein
LNKHHLCNLCNLWIDFELYTYPDQPSVGLTSAAGRGMIALSADGRRDTWTRLLAMVNLRNTQITARAYVLVRMREMRVIVLTAGVSPG